MSPIGIDGVANLNANVTTRRLARRADRVEASF